MKNIHIIFNQCNSFFNNKKNFEYRRIINLNGLLLSSINKK